MDRSTHSNYWPVLILLTIFDNGWSLKEPFDLKFGPDAGDKWMEKFDDYCSVSSDLNGPLRYDNKTITQLQTCSNVALKLIDDEGSEHRIYIAKFDGDLQDRFLDRMCLTPSYYDEYDYQDYICNWYLNYDAGSVAYEPQVADYATEVFPLIFEMEKAYEWDYIEFLRKNVDIYFDDLMTIVHTGADSKYVNLVNNVFSRNILRQEDKDIINSRIGQDFSAESGFVVSFYKIKDYDYFVTYHISVQFVLASDDRNTAEVTDNKCYTMTQFQKLNPNFEDDSEIEASFDLGSGRETTCLSNIPK